MATMNHNSQPPTEPTGQQQSVKPLFVKPQLYAHYFEIIKSIAKNFGYNLLIHGSMNRDCDLVAVPWVDNPQTELRLIQAIEHALTKTCVEDSEDAALRHYMFKRLPGGRHSYVINLNRGGYYKGRDEDGERIYEPDPQYYLDISITPLKP